MNVCKAEVVAYLQVATAAFKTLMAVMGDTHQYEALLGCRSVLPTGETRNHSLAGNQYLCFRMKVEQLIDSRP